jgi:hypothetical protein
MPENTPQGLIRKQMINVWVPGSKTDSGWLAGLLLSSIRSLSQVQGTDRYTKASLAYKGECMRSVNRALATESKNPSDATIAKALALASDEVRENLDGPWHGLTDALQPASYFNSSELPRLTVPLGSSSRKTGWR